MATSTYKTLRTYRAVCFDMDGTLLPMDLDVFLKTYFGAVAHFVGAHGRDAEAFVKGLKAGTAAMAAHDGMQSNADAFWTGFFPAAGFEDTPDARADWTELLREFYTTDFGKVGASVEAVPAVARALKTLSEKGYPLALLTMPMFPEEAVEWRLRWSGADPNLFARKTTYENSTAVKPKLEYYAENLVALGLKGEDVLMVGNNTVEDGVFAKLGADVFFVTDYLIDPVEKGVEAQLHGTMDDFALWCEMLPACANPAEGISDGLVPHEDMLAILAGASEAVSEEETAAAAQYNNEASGGTFF